MAYDIEPCDCITYNVTTYLVIKKSSKYSFVKLKKGNVSYSNVGNTIRKLEGIGYKSLAHYIELNQKNKTLKLVNKKC